mgnify:FL=1
MKIDFSTPIKNLDGTAMMRTEGQPWQIGILAAEALLAQPKQGALTVAQVSERYALAMRIFPGEEVEITTAEADIIQRAVADNCAPIAAAQVIAVTNGK